MKIIGVIPARLASTRMHEKVLRSICGKPMIQHVWERVKKVRLLEDVIIACDDDRVMRKAEEFGARAVMTDSHHPNGTSRIAEIAERESADVFLNIQGDEPLIEPNGIAELAAVFAQDPGVDVATLAIRKSERTVYEDPNIVKVVCDRGGNALYFSRSPIPYDRENAKGRQSFDFLKHLGIYGYKKKFLLDFVRWETGALEQCEKLEQLRILEAGKKIRVVETSYDAESVDTEEDLKKVEKEIEKRAQKREGV